LDAVLGKPAAGISVRLEKLPAAGGLRFQRRRWDTRACAPGDWIEAASGVTDADGRCRDLAQDAAAGLYRLTFDTGAYLARMGRTSIYPEISITFTCDGEAHYHLPLLLSDNSYTTYRGS
jgi:5-hydroxyisourate hydrolase